MMNYTLRAVKTKAPGNVKYKENGGRKKNLGRETSDGSEKKRKGKKKGNRWKGKGETRRAARKNWVCCL